MPPKSKGKKAAKGKAAAVVDGLSTEEMSKDQLEEHIVRLREELDREREERSYFQLERDRGQGYWEATRRSLEENKAELRRRTRDREEAEERHRVEITVYKQKLKHVLWEQHAAAAALKADGAAAAAVGQRLQAATEINLRTQQHGLQRDLHLNTLHNQDCIKQLQLKHQVELMEQANIYKGRLREIEVKYHKKMQSLIEQKERRQREEVTALDDVMKSRVVALVDDHDRSLRQAKEYYGNIQTKMLADQKQLKEELAVVTKQQTRADKELSAAKQENKRLSEGLQEAQRKLSEQRTQLQENKRAQARMAAHRAQAKLTETELRNLTVEHELLLQAFEKVQQERDELLQRQTESVHALQRRAALRELLLRRKMAALTEAVQRKEAELSGALAASGGDGGGKLEEILEAKGAAIDALQRDLDRECTEYDGLLLSCRDKMAALGFPLNLQTSQQILDRP